MTGFADEDIYAGLAVFALIICNAIAIPFLKPVRRLPWYASFTAGTTAVYVFLILLPEIDGDHATLGQAIHLVTLAGFVIFYLVTVFLAKREGRNESQTYTFEMALAFVYQFLLVLTLHENLPMDPWLAPVYVLGVGLHLVQHRHGMVASLDRARDAMTTAILVSALIAGWLLGLATEFSESMLDTLTALIAGSMMFRAFREDFETETQLYPLAFVAGTALLACTHLAAA
ncbi:MAG: hypothetical protein QNJ09_17500 [Paracoccaceae bacterium]|nr:hypothetical protein [Paracoccaceae bacterium]